MVRMAMRYEHDADRRAGDPHVEGVEVAVVVGTRVDHRDDWTGVDDPGVRPGSGVRAGIGRDDPAD
jgi:hypothetical protein